MKKLILILWALIVPTVVYAQGVQELCYTSNGSNCIQAAAASNSVKIDVSTGTTTQLVALVAGKQIFVSGFSMVSTAAQTAKFVYGTGSSCGTGTTDITGAYGMSTFTVINYGGAVGTIFVVPSGNALCIVSTTTGQLSGIVSYVQY